MRLDISNALQAEGEAFPFSGEVPLADTEASGEVVTYPVPATLTGVYENQGGTIRLAGEIAFTASVRCMRCLDPMEIPTKASFNALFAPEPGQEDPDVYPYSGKAIDISQMAADAALLALPMQWRCREDCRGLCPVCGGNLNEIPCSCRVETLEKHPFSALRQLFTENESEV